MMKMMKSTNEIGLRYTLTLLFSIISCGSLLSQERIPRNTVVFPPPPDSTRIIYLTKISSSYDVKRKQSRLRKFIFGADERMAIGRPYGMAIKNGKIYVCQIASKTLADIDLNNNTFRYFFPKEKGAQLKNPINCFIDERNYLYVADGARGLVIIYDDERKFLATVGDSLKNRPTDVMVYNDKIWTADMATSEIEIYESRPPYKHIRTFPGIEKDVEGYLYGPVNIDAFGGKIYVSDVGDLNVKIYSQDGEYLSTIGSPGQKAGHFARNKGIAVDRDSNLFVVDAAFQNVQIFNNKNQLLLAFAGGYQGPGYLYLPAAIVIDYDNIDLFKKYADPRYDLKYLIFVTSQFGPDVINVYAAVEPALLEQVDDEVDEKKKRKKRKEKRDKKVKKSIF